MRITKYPQSNFLIESNRRKILIDPGNLTFKDYSIDDFGKIDAILITHQHPDHLDKEAVRKLVEKNIPLYGNHDVSSQFEEESIEISKVVNEKNFEVAGFEIKPIDLPHCQMLWCDACNKKITPETISPNKKCSLHPDQEPNKVNGPPNTGYLINGDFFHPGDGIVIKDLNVKNASIPIGGPTIDYDKAWKLVQSLNSQVIIPMHYSITSFGANPKEFNDKKQEGVRVVILENEEHLEIS